MRPDAGQMLDVPNGELAHGIPNIPPEGMFTEKVTKNVGLSHKNEDALQKCKASF
jgi:ABC-type molybdate transport system substrate-binding protein